MANDQRSSVRDFRVGRDLDIASLSTHRPAGWQTDVSSIPRHFIRQILGLNPFRTSYFALFRPLKDVRSRLLLAAGIVLAFAAGIPLPIIGLIFGKIINSFPPPEDELRTRLGQLLGVATAYFLVTWGWAVCWGMIGERVSRGLREQIVERALGMEMAYFEVDCPDIVNRLTADTQTIQLGTSEKVGLFLQSISYFVAAFTVGFILNARLTAILFAAVIPPMALIVCGGSTLVSRFSRAASEISTEAAAIAEGSMKAVQVVQAFGALEILSDKHVELLGKAAAKGVRKSFAGAIMLGSVYFVAYSANALAFWQGSNMIAEGQSGAAAGTIYAVVFLILDASFVIGSFGPFIQTFALAASAGGKVLDILDHPESHINVYSEEGVRAKADDILQDIRCQSVTFVYPARPTARVLEGVNLHFGAGKMIGVVGASGSGKSTIASLLLRLYDPSSGRVTIGKRDIRDFHIPSLRKHISLVDQDPVLFSGSIMENIMLGLGDTQDLSETAIHDMCLQAARDANAYEFICVLPEKFDTKVGNAGATQLSGGQKQRICLARALVKSPSLLILDEPTSGLDANSEYLVLEALNRVSRDTSRTTIMIAHRLSTVKECDQIMVMGSGELLESGTHAELMEQNGPYRGLVQAQALEGGSSILPGSVAGPANAPEDAHRSGANDVQDDSSAEPPKTMSTGSIMKRSLALTSMITGAIIVGEAIIFGHLISILKGLDDPEALMQEAHSYCLMFFVLAIVALFAYFTSGVCFGIVSERLILRTKDESLRTILRQDMAWHSEPGHSAHALMSSIMMDSGHLSGLSGVIIGTILSVTTSMVGGIVLAHAVAWKIAIVLLAAVPVMIVAGFLRLRVLAKFEQRHETAYNEAAALASEACTSIRTVAALGQEHHILKMYRKTIDKPYRQSLRFIIVGNVFLALALAITYFVYSLAYWWGSKQVRSGEYSVLQFFIVLPALLFSAQASGQMFSVAPEITRAKAAASSVFSLHDQHSSIQPNNGDAKSLTEIKGVDEMLASSSSNESTKTLPRSRGEIKFCNVSLTYQSRLETQVLNDINLTIGRGEFVAFVGPSGAGKTSAISLLERFCDPTKGSILIDGVDISKIAVEKHRERLALVAQEPDLFSGSVAFNVGLGAKPGQQVGLDDIQAVCASCGVHEFIMGLPDGYQTDCGLNGSQLSGGQKQRLAIARALLRDPDILLLDEATSALDAHSEIAVQQAVAAAATADAGTGSHARTTVVVAHRLSSVQKADRIYVFDGGKVVECGKHEELIARGGIYANLVRAQMLA
ncbi:MAG: hypothetical protein M1833_004963 [Piccolia ochrophora]|nr:MAG: hypothetical protein M1833_004963 [Piccolia ochrophora]